MNLKSAFRPLALATLVALGTGGCSRTSPEAAAPRTPIDAPAATTQVIDNAQVSEVVESAPYLTEELITPELIHKVEEATALNAEHVVAAAYLSEGRKIQPIGFTATSMTVKMNDEPVVVVDLHTPSSYTVNQPPLSFKVIWWIQNHQLKRVFCVDRTIPDINIRRGKCGHQISKTFGYAHWYMEES